MVMPYSRIANVDGALTENQSLRANGSVRFFNPFLPLDNLLFFPTAMIAACDGKRETVCVAGGDGRVKSRKS